LLPSPTVLILFLGGFLGSGIVEQEELCERCYELYMAKQNQTPGKSG
jgi:hypothetical protein